jgi:acyl-CoA synthetase (AMP-forming)/AMP-acid ligase II
LYSILEALTLLSLFHFSLSVRVDAFELKSAFLDHRAYIDSCVSSYTAAGVTNAADYLELCCERHSIRPALEHVRVPSNDGHDDTHAPLVITYDQLNRMAARMACLWLARGFGTDTSAADSAGIAAAASSSASVTAPTATTTIIHSQAGNASDGVVGLLMENCPFYVAVWFSLAKLGRTVALLSTALKSASQMKHSIDIARVRVVVVSSKYKQIWEETVKLYETEGSQPPTVYWSEGASVNFDPMHSFDAAEALSNTTVSFVNAAGSNTNDVAVVTPPAADALIECALISPYCAREAPCFDFAALRRARRVGMESALFYIFTSGTTGACWGKGTNLMLYDGSTMSVEDIVASMERGEMIELMGDDNTVRHTILGTQVHGHTGTDSGSDDVHISVPKSNAAMYRITSMNKGRLSWTCNGQHTLVLKYTEMPSNVHESTDHQSTEPYYFDAYTVIDGKYLRENEWSGGQVIYKRYSYGTRVEADEARASAIAEWEPFIWECTVDEFLRCSPTTQRVAQMYQPNEVIFPERNTLKMRLLKSMKHVHDEKDPAVQLKIKALVNQESFIQLSAWVLGMWLTDGIVKRVEMAQSHTASVKQLIEWYNLSMLVDEEVQMVEEYPIGSDVSVGVPMIVLHPNVVMQKVSTVANHVYSIRLGPVLEHLLKQYNIFNKKSFPPQLLTESKSVRMALLAGVIDGDGCLLMDQQSIQLPLKNRSFIDGVIHLARGIGVSTGHVDVVHCTNKETRKVSEGFQICMTGMDLSLLPCVIRYKRFGENMTEESNKDHRCDSFTVTKINHAPYYGFMVDGNSRHLMGDFVVTHNSKAALFSHRRFLGAGVTWAWPMELTAEDRYFIVLPLFHGNGGVVALSACAHVGAVALIRERFSVSTFWHDVAHHRATAMIYVGELWRYLYNASKSMEATLQPGDTLPLVNSTLRVIAGNGLRADIWEDIALRFARPASSISPHSNSSTSIPLKIVEHYGMTEMPAGPYLNFYGRPGACGFIPPDIRAKQGADKLVEFDLELNAVKRVYDDQAERSGLTSEGRCIEVLEPGAVGECAFLLAPGVVAGASQADNPHTERGAVDRDDSTALIDPLGNPLYLPYRNYTDATACARRVYRSVFSPKDAWFATGDLLSRDRDGFFFFADRAGDSYRWKGHNIVSNEVSEVITAWDSVRITEANVYGVEWSMVGEGRVGMASILWRDDDSLAPPPHSDEFNHEAADAGAVNAAAPAAVLSPTSASLPPSFDPRGFLHHLRSLLPFHAIPAFIRLRSTSNSQTSTFKFQKHLYAKEGFNPNVVTGIHGDILLWWPGAALTTKEAELTDRYELLTQETFQTISGINKQSSTSNASR